MDNDTIIYFLVKEKNINKLYKIIICQNEKVLKLK